MVPICFNPTKEEAEALARFLDHHNTVREYMCCGADSVEQAYLMRNACEKLRTAITQSGFGPSQPGR